MANANPSINPANNGSMEGMLRHVFKKILQEVDGMLPAQVTKVHEDGKFVQVQPLINVTSTEGEEIPRALISKIPVFTLGAGDWLIRFPVVIGTAGWIQANDRDISLYTQSGTATRANTPRVKSFSDAIFFPQAIRDYEVDAEDENNLTIQNKDGSIKIALSDDKIKIKAPDIELDGDVNITGELNVEERLICQSDIASGGNITAVGDITPNTPIPP